jgi:hypothetical protein
VTRGTLNLGADQEDKWSYLRAILQEVWGLYLVLGGCGTEIDFYDFFC